MSSPIDVLIVEDSAEDAELLARQLRSGGKAIESHRVDTAASMAAALDARNWDIVIADYTLPQFSGLEALKLLRNRALDIPLIVVSGKIGEDVAVEAMKAGANDYILKDRLARLLPAVEREVRKAGERRLRRHAERELQESQDKYRRLVANVPDVLWTADRQGKCTFVSPHIERICGYTVAELLNSDRAVWFECVHPEDVENVRVAYEALFTQGDRFDTEYRFRRKDGEWIWLHDRSTTAYERDGVFYADGLFTEITDRKRGAEAKAMLAAIIESSDDAIIGKTLDGRIVSWNDAACRTFGYTLEEMKGLGTNVLDPPECADEMKRIDAAVERGELIQPFETQRIRKDGHRIPVSIAVSPIKDGAGRVVGASEIVRDITEQKRAETELQLAKEAAETANRELAEKNKKLSELYETAHRFVDDVSHEFRTPLTVIKEFALIIRDGLAGPITDEQREYLGIINTRVEDLGGMVDDMLDTSKLEAGLLAVYRRRCTVEEILEPIRPTLEQKASAHKVVLEIALPEELPTVYCDPEKIGRTIVNLTVNAIKVSKPGKSVVVWSKWDGKAGDVRIGVTDHGPGIAPESMAPIFERFTQIDGHPAPSKGFGLGLNIAKELVHLNFGDISVESKVGEGSTFVFTIPTAELRPLLSRYWDKVHQFRETLRFACLLHLGVKSADPEMIDELDAFIQHQIRRTDLMFHSLGGGWSVVVATSTPDPSDLIKRLSEALEELNRNRPSEPLPHLVYEVTGVWRMPDHLLKFLAAAEASVDPGERSAARNMQPSAVHDQPQDAAAGEAEG